MAQFTSWRTGNALEGACVYQLKALIAKEPSLGGLPPAEKAMMNVISTRSQVVIGLGIAAALNGLLSCTPGFAAWGGAQTTQRAQPTVVRPIGTISSIQGNAITLKTDAGVQVNVVVQDSTRMLRIAPGQKDLEGAVPVRLEELQIGDRILVGGKPSEDNKSLVASSIIAIKRVEIEQKRQQVEEDWQKRGVGGLVSVVDAARWTITIKVRSIGGSRDLAIHITNHTVLRRYAPDSVKFSDAKPGTFDQIKPGDQLRALGARSADGNELTAQEIVSGSFRNIAGTVASVDAGAHEISVMDLITKKPIVVKFTADSQLRNMPPMMAQAVAARLKRGTPGASGGGERPPGGEGNGGAGPGPGSSAGAEHPFGGAAAGHGPGGAPDLQQMLTRLPPARLTDLQKGEAVMIVSTQGAAPTEVTAITLLSGVEPILTASASSGAAQPMLLSPWSLSAPAGDAANP